MLLILALALVFTSPRPEQISPDQVRIHSSDIRPGGTLVPRENIQDGRGVVPLSTLTHLYGVRITPATANQEYYWPPDASPDTKVVCTQSIVRADTPIYERQGDVAVLVGYQWGRNSWNLSCYTELGQRELLSNPEWLAWYTQQ
jgi:hypothetical protein